MSVLEKELEKIVEPLLGERGMELADVEISRQGGRLLARFFIDRIEGGITVEDCADVNRELGDLLEVEDVIEESYILEVSSPGLNRRLRKLRDFQKYIGCEVYVRTREKLEDRRRFKGTLLTADEQGITVQVSGRPLLISHEQIARAELKYEF